MATVTKEDLPILRGDEARTIDLEVTEKIGRVRILECVATRISDLIQYHLLKGATTTPLLFVAGKGNNGANAIASARILYLRGFSNVHLVLLLDPAKDELRPNIQEQLELYEHFVGKSNLHAQDYAYIQKAPSDSIIVDGILGTGISSPPRAASLEAIQAILEAKQTRVLSIDIPSGLNHITGEAPGVCIQATWTCNLHMFKSGHLTPAAKEYVGELWSVESALGFTTFPEPDKFQRFYQTGPIQKVEWG